MSHNADKATYLGEHLPYELLMLRYTLKEIKTPKHFLDWNVYFESFAIHARNLYDFLTDSRGSNNFKARDFIAQFKVTKEDATRSKLDKLNRQVFHLGKHRPTGQEKKANENSAQQVGSWIETNFGMFINKLEAADRSKWHWDNADLSKIAPNSTIMVHSATASTATNSITIATTE